MAKGQDIHRLGPRTMRTKNRFRVRKVRGHLQCIPLKHRSFDRFRSDFTLIARRRPQGPAQSPAKIQIRRRLRISYVACTRQETVEDHA
jgi:hypothetical protein